MNGDTTLRTSVPTCLNRQQVMWDLCTSTERWALGKKNRRGGPLRRCCVAAAAAAAPRGVFQDPIKVKSTNQVDIVVHYVT